MSAIGDLVVNLVARTKQFTGPMTSAVGALSQLKSAAASSTSGLGGVTAGLGAAGVAATAVVGLAGAIGLVAGKAVAMAASLETSTVAFETLLGSADAAREHLGQLQQFAAKTPFEFNELVGASRRLMALGFESSQTLPILRVVGDAVGALGLGSEGIDRVTLALGQMNAKGKVSAQEINQLAEAGIPAWDMIAKKMGIGIPEAMKLAENGAISSGVGINAVMEGMQQKFGGGMEKQSSTLAGVWSTLRDSVGLVMTEIGQEIMSAFDLTGSISSFTEFVNTFRSTWMPAIRGGIQAVAETWRGTMILFQEAWNGWLGQSVSLLVDFVANFDLYFGVLYQNVILWASNSLNTVTNFFNNAAQMGGWFVDNLGNFFVSAGQFAITVFQNLGENIRGVWSGILSYIQGNGFKFNATPLLDGFESTISAMPNLTSAAIADTTHELDRLYEELGNRQAEATAGAIQAAVPAVAEAAFVPLAEEDLAGKKEKDTKENEENPEDGERNEKSSGDFAGALTKGSAEAVAAIQRAQFGGSGPNKKLEDLGKKQLETQQKMAIALTALADGKGQLEEEVADFG